MDTIRRDYSVGSGAEVMVGEPDIPGQELFDPIDWMIANAGEEGAAGSAAQALGCAPTPGISLYAIRPYPDAYGIHRARKEGKT